MIDPDPTSRYPAYIESTRGVYIVTPKDFPTLLQVGINMTETIGLAEYAVTNFIHSQLADGITVPPPSQVEEGGSYVMLEICPLGAKRVLISIDEDLLKQIDATGETRSSFLAKAARDQLEKKLFKRTGDTHMGSNVIKLVTEEAAKYADNVAVQKLMEKLALAQAVVRSNENPYITNPLHGSELASRGEDGYTLLINPHLTMYNRLTQQAHNLHEVAIIADCLASVLIALGSDMRY